MHEPVRTSRSILDVIVVCGLVGHETFNRGWRVRRPRSRMRPQTGVLGRLGGLVVAALWAIGAGPARADIQIAVAAPLTGRQAAEGKALVQSVEWAAADLNARGGVGGERVVVITDDDACDDGQATGVGDRLAAQRPAVVIGHPCGGAAQSAARRYAVSGQLFIATAPRHPELTRRRAGPTIFRLAGRDDLQSAATAAYIGSAYAGKRLAIVHDRTRYARTLVDGLKRARAAVDPSPVPEFGIVASSKDYAATVGALRALRAEVVYFAGFPSEAVALWSQFGPTDALPDLIGSDALANADTELEAQSSGTRFVTRVVRPFTALDTLAAKPLIDRLATAGHAPHASAVAAYAAVEIWAGAMARSASRDTLQVARQLAGAPVASILGPMDFDQAGDARVPSFEVASFDGGGWTAEAIMIATGQTGKIQDAAETGMPKPVAGPLAPRGNAKIGIARSRAPPLPVRHPLRQSRRAEGSVKP